jgi:hypothetical protein
MLLFSAGRKSNASVSRTPRGRLQLCHAPEGARSRGVRQSRECAVKRRGCSISAKSLRRADHLLTHWGGCHRDRS